jgi:hypothetical protein
MQGEGGIFYNDTYKLRYFVLARVPHATVLIYYGRKCMDDDHIVNYIDLRKVTSVRETTRLVSIDLNESKTNALISRFKSLLGSKPVENATARPVVELVTAGRTYVLAPATVVLPPPLTAAQATSISSGKPLYLFGWPFPVPPLDPVDDEAEVAGQAGEGKFSTEAHATWRETLATAVAAEKATRVFPVITLVDSTASLLERVLLRTTPCELAIIGVDDKDLCYTFIPYNDLQKWEVQVESELHITGRTRARLVARPDRTGFTAQRPTRTTVHFVFKSSAAKAIVSVIDTHLRTLAKQILGDSIDNNEDDAPDASLDEYSQTAQSSSSAGDDDDGQMKKKLISVKSAAKLPVKKPSSAPSDDEDDEPEARKTPQKTLVKSPSSRSNTSSKSSTPVAKSSAKKPAKVESEDEEEEEEKPKPKAKVAAKPVAKKPAKVESEDEDEEEEEKPKPKAKVAAKPVAKKPAKVEPEDEEEDEEEEEEAEEEEAEEDEE